MNGALGNVPVRPDNSLGGFTLAVEEPAYILGNYNADDAGFGDPHAESAVLGDTVTLLSNNWKDISSFTSRRASQAALRPRPTTAWRLPPAKI